MPRTSRSSGWLAAGGQRRWATISVTHLLSDPGVRDLADTVDDFGTGFAGYHSLRELPVDEIKIDRSSTEPGCRPTPVRRRRPGGA